MEKIEKRKLTIWGIVIFAGLVVAIVTDQTNSNKNNREVPESDMLSKKSNKVMPAKPQSKVMNWLMAQNHAKTYAG